MFKPTTTGTPGATAPGASTTTNNDKPEYASQVVILEGVKPEIKCHPVKLSNAFSQAKPNVELKRGGLRMTASGDVLVIPKNPKDCCSLLEKDAFPKTSPLGEAVTARVPKAQQITHQVIIKNVDTSVTQEEMDDILNRQELEYKTVKRIHSREKKRTHENVPTNTENRRAKAKVVKGRHFSGPNAFQMEDTNQAPKVKQCYNCQELGDHLSSECKKPTKCVLCAGPHRKSECTKSKEEFCCANCSENHAAWSNICGQRLKEAQKKQKPTMAQVASASVTPAHLDEKLNEIKQYIALVVAEVVARCLCVLTYDLMEKRLSKINLPMKVASIASDAATAVNKATFGSKPVEVTQVKDAIISKCFPKSQETGTTSQNMNGPSQPQNV